MSTPGGRLPPGRFFFARNSPLSGTGFHLSRRRRELVLLICVGVSGSRQLYRVRPKAGAARRSGRRQSARASASAAVADTRSAAADAAAAAPVAAARSAAALRSTDTAAHALLSRGSSAPARHTPDLCIARSSRADTASSPPLCLCRRDPRKKSRKQGPNCADSLSQIR